MTFPPQAGGFTGQQAGNPAGQQPPAGYNPYQNPGQQPPMPPQGGYYDPAMTGGFTGQQAGNPAGQQPPAGYNPYQNPYGYNPYQNPYGQQPPMPPQGGYYDPMAGGFAGQQAGNPAGQQPPAGYNPYQNPYGYNPYQNPYGQQPPMPPQEVVTQPIGSFGRDDAFATKIKVPAHSLNFNENEFLRLLAGSISLTKDEKRKIIEAVPTLTQFQITELIRILNEEKQKFSELDIKHKQQLDSLQEQHAREWEELEEDMSADEKIVTEANELEKARQMAQQLQQNTGKIPPKP